ncbi:RHS repeat domain-containing protein [Treponema pedis]|uniref:RHS repeat domain-containing protein n=1 Tax=Treponema pedis TaxID=409322 RepID=UPI003D261C76
MWEANRNRDGNTSDSEAAMKSAVFNFVFFVMLKNKIEQSAKTKLLLNNPTDRTFENRWSRYKEPSKNKAEAYLVYVEHLFLRSDAGDARIFSKEEDVYGIDYGFGLDAPKETEQTNPQDLFAYRRNYTWTYKSKTAKLFLTMYNNFLTQQVLKGLNEKNLLTKSSDKNYTVHYRYGEDGQRGLKYTEEGRSETLYFNNFFTIHIPIYDKDNPQGLRVHKHIFVGNSRLVTAMTHTDNSGDNEEQKEKRYYYHSDHLGSAQFVTDWRGKQYEHIEYTPYGELWVEETAPGIDKLPFRFTGKELDEETGLYYYGARYLDPKYSRWLSGDPALGEYIPKAPIDDEAKKHNENLPNGGVYNAINLHVFNYGNNNPIKYNDPTGEIPFMVVTGVIGAFIAGGYSIASDLTNGRNVNWKKAGAYAAAGGLAGLTLGGVAAMVTTTTPLVAGSATASFSSVTGLGVSTTGSAALGLPLASQIYEKFSHALTSAQLSSVKKVAEISHALKTHKNLTGELLDPGHITKLKNSMVGLQKSLISIQNSLKNPNLTQEARNVLKMAENEATSIINRIGELIN